MKGNEDMIRPSEIYAAAVKKLPASDIQNYGCNLYLKVTPKSEELMNHFLYRNSVEVVTDEGADWYFLPLCYNPECA